MRISRRELAQGEELLFLQVVLIEQVKKYEFRIYLIDQKIKKLKKRFTLQFALKFIINISCFDEEAMGCAFQFVEILSKSE